MSVSEAMALAKSQLEAVRVCIIGEVSEFDFKPGYSALYFTIKDTDSSLPCLIWVNQYKSLGIDVELGSMVQVTGKFSLYAAKGRMNFLATHIVLTGEGTLRQMVADRAKRLQATGLFDADHKRPIPQYSEKIGLVTSPRGAAVHDVIRTLNRRFPLATIYFAGVPVEGTKAPRFLMQGMKTVVDAGVDLVLLVRGGGSYEDLMPFNDESLAKTIYRCPVPVVTGIGHEPDMSIADMVADLQASTPTAAAECASQNQSELIVQWSSYKARMDKCLLNNLKIAENFFQSCAGRAYFKDPQSLFIQPAMHLDNRRQSLIASFQSFMQGTRHRVNIKNTALVNTGQNMFMSFHHLLKSFEAKLQALNPEAVLERGYIMAIDENGKVVAKSKDIKSKQVLDLKFADGNRKAEVK
ncbi:MAG: exodeoxyribonuclease VII large subunit [Eggerthellaceae bacterium]|nr:exodeoxyribonuclease VII large subunit [Eggerthellaceae bacterium]